MAPEKLFELQRRTFDTPHFRGIEFIEVEAKSIINHVPGNYLPFSWTINPYRGCSHACSYCAWGETPILMADGRTRPLAELRVGDRIYGTRVEGAYRRYVHTEVLAHWQTIKRGYRVTLEDGTQLVASADHRFLSRRGWKHVIGAEQGPLQRPFLTTNNKLIGTGAFAIAPKPDEDYRRGYLCGMIRGDGTIGRYRVSRSDRADYVVCQFRLALVDDDALQRTAGYLRLHGVDTRERVFQKETATRKLVKSITSTGEPNLNQIEELIAWSASPNDQWMKGFLAGIFDAEGSCSRGVFRVCNCDMEVIDRTKEGLDRFGFRYVMEQTPGTNKPVHVIRLVGGLQERLRFFHLTDPAITRKRSIEGVALKSKARLKVVSIEDLGVEIPMYDITTGTGDFIANGVVSHNCFARATHTYMDLNAGRDFETKIVVKVNAGELLRKELRARKWKGEPIAMGTATDPYQRAEGRYRLMPKIIETLTEYRNPFSILTKGTLILRDLPLLEEAAAVTDVSTAFSIGTLDDDVWRRSEPGTPHPRKRIEAVARLNEAGIPCGVLMAPILPGISDRPEQLRDVMAAAFDAGATYVSPILLHLRPKVREVYMEWLADNYPELVERHETMYRKAYAAAADRNALAATVAEIGDSLGGPRKRKRKPRRSSPGVQQSRNATAALRNEQLKLI
ncbi:MAG TPA: intein-containing Rv2578c family radical SAM protein [Actinomycetota bacterium]|nr:intein-containing Rv2578c family radical SAM protein [Actinomycetota bacterium]